MLRIGQEFLTSDSIVGNSVTIATHYIGILYAVLFAAEWVVNSRGTQRTGGDAVWIGAAGHHSGASVVKDSLEFGISCEAE